MLTFLCFISEATMNATVGSDAGEKHKDNYLNKKVISSTTFTMNKAHEHIPAGAEVNISGVKNIGGKYHAVITHKGKTTYVPISKINKPKIGRAGSNPAKAEEDHLTDLNNQIDKAKKESGSKEITVYTAHGPVSISHAEKVPGTPKADFVLKNKKGESQRFISHKDGSSVKDFQQFGGVSKFKDHPIVKKFASILKKKHPEGVSGETVGMKLDSSNPEHKSFIQRAMYGHGYGDMTFHQDNVHEIHQGPMKLVPHPNGKKGHYILQSNHTYKNGEVPKDMNMMVYARGDSNRSDLGVNKTRVLVGPESSRKVSKFYK